MHKSKKIARGNLLLDFGVDRTWEKYTLTITFSEISKFEKNFIKTFVL